MTRPIRSTVLCGATLASLLLLSACGKSEAPPPSAPAAASTAAVTTPVPAPATTTTPAASSTATAEVAPAPAAEPAEAPASTPLTVAKLTLGSAVNAEHQVTRASTSFAANDNILYASVATEGSSGGATLNAKWSYLEGKGQLVSNISQSIATDGPATTTFKVQNPDLWPAGKYQVEISLDGKSIKKQEFQIKKS